MPSSLRWLIFLFVCFTFSFSPYLSPNHQARYHLTEKLNVWHNVTSPMKPVFWNRNTSMVYAVLLAAPWAGAVWIHMFGDNISFKHTLFFLGTHTASILWMCKEFCNLLLNIISLILQPNKQVKTWRQTNRARQLNVKLCLLRWKYRPADKFLLSSNILSHCDAPHKSNTYPKPPAPVDGMAYSIVFHTCMEPEGWSHCGGTQQNAVGNPSWASFFPFCLVY